MRVLIRGMLVLVMGLPLLGCGSSGPNLYPVTGTVTVNGKPAALVRVQFLHADQSLPGNQKMPVGITDESGAFHLSTSGDKDGAVQGEYTVVFEWMSGNDLGAFDKFGGKFADSKITKFKAKVDPKATTLPPFEITVRESSIVTKPPRGN
jgi:5-hydroxyisourate hydrolase-like protein (transthyretin family)